MILEVADIRITPGRQVEFERAAHHGIKTVIGKSKGFLGYQVRQSVESPERYLLLLEWETVEDHTIGFRGSAAFALWRSMVFDFFAQPPYTEHFEARPDHPFAHAAGARVDADVAMDTPIQSFSDCHAGIARVLDDLTGLSRRTDSASSHSEIAARVLSAFTDLVIAHHKDEESELFPAVTSDALAGNEHTQVMQLVGRLVDEHRRIEGRFAQLTPDLSAIANNRTARLDAAAVTALVADYRAHARFEEEIFLPLAQSILGRNNNHLAALGLALHIRHVGEDVRRRFGSI